jgi:hypothetical protein
VSKVDAQRAMREARFAAYRAKQAAAPAPASAPTEVVAGATAAAGAPSKAPDRAKPPRRSPPTAEQPAELSGRPAAPDDEPAASLCGHRSISNKTCRRPAGHAEKNHRYS